MITQEDIRNSGAMSLDGILRRVPGFQVRQWLWGFTNTSINGLLGGSPINERLLWLVDGVVINDVRDGGIWTDLTIFPLDQIERIEMILSQALEMIKHQAFDLIFLDIIMPKMNGYQVLERLKADDTLRHIPVIVISALSELESAARCIEMGAEDYLPQPFNAVLLR